MNDKLISDEILNANFERSNELDDYENLLLRLRDIKENLVLLENDI